MDSTEHSVQKQLKPMTLIGILTMEARGGVCTVMEAYMLVSKRQLTVVANIKHQ